MKGILASLILCAGVVSFAIAAGTLENLDEKNKKQPSILTNTSRTVGNNVTTGETAVKTNVSKEEPNLLSKIVNVFTSLFEDDKEKK
ncbi:MAG: hypothetical protein ABID79_05505 [Elusimicrobiota bacterium]